MLLMVNANMLMTCWHNFKKADYKFHLVTAFVIRIIFVLYGVYHDSKSVVQYTDIDYKVFTDAARHILNSKSPFDRHTYRYTPLLAILLVPNLVVHHTFGKIFFCVVDIVVGFLIRMLVKSALTEYECFKLKGETDQSGVNLTRNAIASRNHIAQEKRLNKRQWTRHHKRPKFRETYHRLTNESEIIINISMLIWLYNPMSIAISTRGNCDSIAGLLVLATLYFLQCKRAYFLAGLVHGLSIHVRLYPIVYSLALFMFLSRYSFYSFDGKKKGKSELKAIQHINESGESKTVQTVVLKKRGSERKTIFNKKYLLYLIPNSDQIKLIFGCLISVVGLTSLFCYLYGYTFLYETCIYHLIRKDACHNFSLYFYLQYLTAGVKNVGVWQRVLTVLPQLVLLIVLSVRYGLNKFSLNFSVLTQTIVMVTFNSVLTSQYFIWIMAVLPLCVWQIKVSAATAFLWVITWFIAQSAWLLPAYFLEFHGQNTYLLIWIQGVALFCANIAILGRLIMNFMPMNKYKTM